MKKIIITVFILIGINMDTTKIRTLANQILTECDILDCQTSPNPTPSPTGIDCLAGPTPPATNMIASEVNEAPWLASRATFRTSMKDTPSGHILFIGDSQIKGLNTSLVTSKGLNLGISGESSRQLLYRINETDSNNQPNFIHRAGAVVIETFVNDLGDNTTYPNPQTAVDTIRDYMLPRLAQWLSGKVVIICPTKVDVNKGFWTQNSAIEQMSTLIKNKFAGRADVRVIDINPIIAPNGTLLPEYFETNGPGTGDGHHLNAAGQQVKADAIKSALQSLQVPL